VNAALGGAAERPTLGSSARRGAGSQPGHVLRHKVREKCEGHTLPVHWLE